MNSFKKKERLSFEMALARAILIISLALVARQLRPWNLSPWVAFALGVFMGLVFVLFEARLEKVTLKRLIGAAVGSIVGILGAWMVSLLLVGSLAVRGNTVSFIQICLLMLMGYVGLILGANKGDLLNLSALGGLFGGERASRRAFKILDTSVIIDGRIADVAETGFLDGVLVIPQFVLRELQLVADSSDALKRNRAGAALTFCSGSRKAAAMFRYSLSRTTSPMCGKWI